MKTAAVRVMAIVSLAGAFYLMADSNEAVPYPADYRRWTVTRSFIAASESQNSSFHHYYANDKAMEGFTSGVFPNGSVIVDERLEVDRRGAESFEGKRISVSVMRKDNQRYAATGGWGFDAAKGDHPTLDAPPELRAASGGRCARELTGTLAYSVQSE